MFATGILQGGGGGIMDLQVESCHFDHIFDKVIMQGKLFQRCTHLLYCSVLSLGGNVNTGWMSKPDIKNQCKILVIGNYQIIKI